MHKPRRYRVRFYNGQKIRSGRQLKAARVMAGLKQAELADAAGLHVNTIRNMEAYSVIGSARPALERVEDALEQRGVIVTADPKLGVYLA